MIYTVLSYHLQTLHSSLEPFTLVNQAIKFICVNLLIDINTSCNRQIVMLRRLFISCHIYKFIYSILFAVFPIKATCKVFMIYSTTVTCHSICTYCSVIVELVTIYRPCKIVNIEYRNIALAMTFPYSNNM